MKLIKEMKYCSLYYDDKGKEYFIKANDCGTNVSPNWIDSSESKREALKMLKFEDKFRECFENQSIDSKKLQAGLAELGIEKETAKDITDYMEKVLDELMEVKGTEKLIHDYIHQQYKMWQKLYKIKGK